MKLLHLSEFYAAVGGLEQYLLAVSEACEAAGHRVVVVHGARTGREPEPAVRPAFHVPDLAGPAPAPRPSLQRLADLLAREAPDLIMIHEILEPEAVRTAAESAPTIRFVHGHKIACPGGRRLWAPGETVCARPLGFGCQVQAYRHRCMPRDPRRGLPLIRQTRALLHLHRRWSELIAPSHFVQGLLIRNGFAPGQVHVAPYFTSLPDRPGPAGDSVPGRLLCAARLAPGKGIEHVLRALRDMPPPAHLVIAGEGPARTSLEAAARDLGVAERVRFLGWLDPAAMADALAGAQVVVVPSLWPETFGIVGIEAMAHARAVVAYDSGGIVEWLRPEQTGCLVQRGNIPALRAAITSLLGNPVRRQQFGESGRRIVAGEFLAAHHLARLFPLAEAARARWQAATGGPGSGGRA